MSAEKKSSVLVCVTGQYDCDRLIEAGFERAVELGWDLHVFCVHTPTNDLTCFSDEIEYLYRTAKSLGADMTISFSGHAARAAADFARTVNAKHLITGMPDERPNGFVLTVQEMLPRLQITTVTKEGDRLLYTLNAETRAYA